MLPVEAGCLQKPSGFRLLFPDDAGARRGSPDPAVLGLGLPTPPIWLVINFKEMFSW